MTTVKHIFNPTTSFLIIAQQIYTLKYLDAVYFCFPNLGQEWEQCQIIDL